MIGPRELVDRLGWALRRWGWDWVRKFAWVEV